MESEYSELPGNAAEMRLSPYKKDFAHSYVFGVFPIIELADNRPSALFRIILSSKLGDEGRRLLTEKAAAAGVPVVTDDRTIERHSPKENCFADGAFRKFSALPDPGADHVVLVNPSDRGNLGSIVRSAVAFGFRDIAVVRPAADIFDPHAVRASMGALFRIRPAYFDTFDEYLTAAGRRMLYPFMLCGAPMEAARPDRSQPCSLIFGNESAGLDESFARLGLPLRITHENTVDSLNLNVAAGIGLHWFRQEVR